MENSMPNPQPTESPSANSQILVLRIIWAALIFGGVVFTALVAFVLIPNRTVDRPQPILTTVSFVMTFVVMPVTFLVRRGILKRASPTATGVDVSTGPLAPMAAYSTGNILFWAGCEGVAFFAAVVAMLNANVWPTIVNVAVAVACQLITFPTAMKLESLTASRLR
jgi:hypothetical protein